MSFHDIVDPERLHALIEAMLLIEVEAPLPDILTQITRMSADLVGAPYGALGVLNREGTQLAEFITVGISDQERAGMGPSPTGHGVLGQTIRARRPVRVEDLRGEENSNLPPGHPPMHAFLGVPIVTRDGHVWGNLYVTTGEPGRQFSEDDERLLETFGRAAGIAIDQANLRRSLRDLTVAEERERLARDLHDTVIQRLFGVGLSLQIALPRAEGEVASRVDSALEELNSTIHEIRTTIFEIDQDATPGATLRQRASALVAEVDQRLGLQTHFEMDLGVSSAVSEHVADQSVHALREILSNVVRHARAEDVEVRIRLDGDYLVMTVRDDGVGVGEVSGAGRGLRNLRSRASDLGGMCLVESGGDSGTLVTWRVPKGAE